MKIKTKKRKNMSPIETKRQPCEVYSRVCGYLRPVQQWNDSKQAEFSNRKMFNVKECDE
jgi:anaerobic ribonucleoside-triphosphate reductase